ncbi:MAG: phosphonate ABC transporter, permease protein PhnE, partial [Betaproteobacteria bacterium]|nr:phosphonate ABC transporter, permease protein PhnE [Betaproteobacteria bacterium]
MAQAVPIPPGALDPPGAGKRTLSQAFGWAMFVLILAWAWKGADVRPLDLVKDSGNMAKFLTEFFPPDFREWKSYLREMVVTVHIAVWG